MDPDSNTSASLALSHPSPSRRGLSNNENLTNFMKYGSIRPPLSVLQDEFIEQYKILWKEHEEPLNGIDKSKSSAEDVSGYMSIIRTLHAKYNRTNNIDTIHDDNIEYTSHHHIHGEEKAEVGTDSDSTIDSNDNNEKIQLEKLIEMLFRPGSKLAGSIQIDNQDKASTNYELVVMQLDSLDELGKEPRGILARHKFGGDEQCVFIKLSIVPLVIRMDDDNKEKESDDGDMESTVSGGQKKLTIQIEYVDGDNAMKGVWNYDTLCFEGTVTKLSEGHGEQSTIGGTIMFISGHNNVNEGGSGSNENNTSDGEENDTSRRSTVNSTKKFSLSPCTHVHHRGIASEDEDSISQDPKTKSLIPEKHETLLDEVASDDNHILVLHRARTESLRRETLTKLTELGGLIDFADLARKRHVHMRKEKRRKMIRRYTPKLPRRRPFRRNRMKDDEYDLSKDKVQEDKVHFFDQIAAISWADLLEEASIQSEITCAVFRRQTRLLDTLTFTSGSYKAQVMSDLRNSDMTLAGSHAEWDKCIQMGRTVALGWSWFERGSWSCWERSAVVGKQCVHLLFKMHTRLEANHKSLETAFRLADTRLTNEQLEEIKNSSVGCNKPEEDEGSEDLLCGVCQEKTEDESDSVCILPCSHMFHWRCLTVWLHNHTQCPICRLDLTNVS